ncbi:MAG TPA: VCBS repeat-containing protein [Gemmatimonadales bacterium]|nr:VCBS repeat-containing protein [Gemmatimonadales bacterium]
MKALALVTIAAAGTFLAAALPQRPEPAFRRVLNAFPVYDSTGQRYQFPFLGGLNNPRPQLVDIDGDGDLDLFVQEFTGRMMYFENTGSAKAPAFTWRSDDYERLEIGEWSRFVDVDGDGDWDIVAETPYSYIRYYRNEGSRTQAAYTLATDTLRDDQGKAIFNDRQNIPQMVDIDCDGKLDLLMGRTSGMVTHYEATGVGGNGVPVFHFVSDTFQHIQIIGAIPPGGKPSLHGANTMIVSDVDRDGDPDLLWGDYFEPGLLWLKNTGTCQAPIIGQDSVSFPPGAPLRTSGYNAPFMGDLDGDGDLDLMMGVLGGAFNANTTAIGNLYYLEQTAPMSFTVRSTQFLSQLDIGAESAPAVADVDGDGDPDLVLGNRISQHNPRTGALEYFENQGSKDKPEWHATGALDISGTFNYAPALGDLDGDGKPDMILGTWQSVLAWYRNTGAAGPSRFVIADSAIVTLTRGSNATPTLADVDHDGDLDLFVGEGSGTINFYRNDGTKQQPKFVLVSDEYAGIEAGRRSAPALMDVDGDGDLDLLVGNESGVMQLYRNAGTRSAPDFRQDTSFVLHGSFNAIPAVADMDGDGRPELLLGGSGGGVQLWTRDSGRGTR